MANNNKNQESVDERELVPTLCEIGQLRVQHNISWPVFAGVCGAHRWQPGKMVSEKEFRDAVTRFCASPMDTRKARA